MVFLAKDALIQTVVTDRLRSFPAGEWREADDGRQHPDHGDHRHGPPPRPELPVANRLGDGAVTVDADQNEVEDDQNEFPDDQNEVKDDQNEVEDGCGAQKNVRGEPEIA